MVEMRGRGMRGLWCGGRPLRREYKTKRRIMSAAETWTARAKADDQAILVDGGDQGQSTGWNRRRKSAMTAGFSGESIVPNAR